MRVCVWTMVEGMGGEQDGFGRMGEQNMKGSVQGYFCDLDHIDN